MSQRENIDKCCEFTSIGLEISHFYTFETFYLFLKCLCFTVRSDYLMAASGELFLMYIQSEGDLFVEI